MVWPSVWNISCERTCRCQYKYITFYLFSVIQVEVMVGSSECEIDSMNDTEIVCYTGRGSATVVVSNAGTDPSESYNCVTKFPFLCFPIKIETYRFKHLPDV